MKRTVFLVGLIPYTAGFVSPNGLAARRETTTKPMRLHSLPSFVLSSDELLPEDVVAAVSNEANGLMGTVTTVLTVISAVAFFLFGLTYITAAWIVPKAAEKVEQEAAESAPELLEAYRAKLKEGETFAMRPDLIQELAKQMEEQNMIVVSTDDDERGANLKSPSPPEEPDTDQTAK